MPRTPKQEDFLATARKSQEIMADAIRTWVETVRTATPSLSSFYTPLANRLPKVPLPRPGEAVASAYDLAERLLASQRKFAEDLVKATRPLMPGFGVGEPEGHSKATAQDHSRTAQDHSQTAAHVQSGTSAEDRRDGAPQDSGEGTHAGHGETAPRETAAQSAPREPAAEKAEKAAAPKSTTKTTATRRAPKSTATNRAPRSTATKRTPKSSDSD
jgi:DNA-binding protein HU-beta